MYFAGFVIPVPEHKMEAYRRWAETEASGEIPFDSKRLILGCFEPIHVMGR